jgi:C-terminal processing protease CtpA/Prc
MMFDDLYYRDLQWQIANGLTLHRDAPRFPVSDVLPQLTHANTDDFARLSYGLKREITVNPSANRWAFDGKIWLLIDGLSFSASEISAALAKESGFATLVGASTGGIFGGYTAAFIGLPNTGVIIRYDYGYVTDLQGRSLEEFGVSPHVFNRPGMDALQTVLALISEE